MAGFARFSLAASDNPFTRDEPLYRCIESPANSTFYAYALIVGPISEQRKYSKWLYPILAMRRALLKTGSRADLLVLAAVDECCDTARMLASEEAMLAAQDVRIRYVPAPAGIRGFHMGHYKLWAWQHTEYARVQVLDADLLPLVDLDRFFRLPLTSDFVGCPGRSSVLNAGWFSLRPDCAHFRGLISVLYERSSRPGHRWDEELGWGVKIPAWRNAQGRTMLPGHAFFDAKGNQGHMYAYFRFYANDLTLVYSDRIVAFIPSRPKHAVDPHNPTPHDARLEVLATEDARRRPDAPSAERRLAAAVYDAFPCPFSVSPDHVGVAYYHFTGNVKPWTRYDPENVRFRQWYAVLSEIGIDAKALILNSSVVG